MCFSVKATLSWKGGPPPPCPPAFGLLRASSRTAAGGKPSLSAMASAAPERESTSPSVAAPSSFAAASTADRMSCWPPSGGREDLKKVRTRSSWYLRRTSSVRSRMPPSSDSSKISTSMAPFSRSFWMATPTSASTPMPL
jgi:hypothetical protein